MRIIFLLSFDLNEVQTFDILFKLLLDALSVCTTRTEVRICVSPQDFFSNINNEGIAGDLEL